jgi:uncharacterized protein (DUF927 family)
LRNLNNVVLYGKKQEVEMTKSYNSLSRMERQWNRRSPAKSQGERNKLYNAMQACKVSLEGGTPDETVFGSIAKKYGVTAGSLRYAYNHEWAVESIHYA